MIESFVFGESNRWTEIKRDFISAYYLQIFVKL